MKPDLTPPDPLRMRVPVWRCPTCQAKFYSRAELEQHYTEAGHLPAVQKEQG
jgi:ribosomal protein L37AE/L43A